MGVFRHGLSAQKLNQIANSAVHHLPEHHIDPSLLTPSPDTAGLLEGQIWIAGQEFLVDAFELTSNHTTSKPALANKQLQRQYRLVKAHHKQHTISFHDRTYAAFIRMD